MLENKEKQVDENTVMYFQPNHVLTNIMIVLEILYCLGCMVLFLLLIYWNAKGNSNVIFGQNSDFDSDEEMVPDVDA